MKGRRKILLRPGSIGVTDCWWHVHREGIDVCVYGAGFWSGCSSDCNYAAVPTNIELLLAGSYNLSGTVVHYHNGLAIAGMPVSFILPTLTRYSTRTDSKGRFKIQVKHDSRAGKRPSYRVDLDYGKMETAPEAKHIVLWGDLTRTFRNAHPEIEFLDLKVSEFRGKTIYMGRRKRAS
jgi:hypothetical protein